MAAMKTPGVYIVEKNAFPNSVVEVATAVPAFIGHTEIAVNGNKSLTNKPWRITSMAEYRSYFGGEPSPVFEIQEAEGSEPELMLGGKGYKLVQSNPAYSLYYNMLLFYANGGGPCYIVSVGDYTKDFEADKFTAGVETLVKEQEPTVVLVPEAVCLAKEACVGVQQAVLMHCGNKMKNRFAILDVFGGYKGRQDPDGDSVMEFREAIGSNFLAFGAAYYPWLNTSVVSEKSITYANVDIPKLKELLEAEIAEWKDENRQAQLTEQLVKLEDAELAPVDRDLLHTILLQNSQVYRSVLKEIRQKVNLLPPGAAMAGLYTMVDNTRGVWKAPANYSLCNVVTPTVNISHDDQEDLNVPLSGKAVNAIRTFTGEGVKVWGARTLDGNSLDWRYINVRRTMIFLEESVKNAARAYVFDPNEANTWLNIKSMIENFLRGVWKRGGLAGAVPEDAYSVHVGLGDTMTPEDILEGIMRITVLVAITRPAEFIEITFQQQMQKS